MLCQVLAKVGASEDNIKKALDVKSAIESTLQRIHKLNIPSFKTQSAVVKQGRTYHSFLITKG